MYEPIEKLNVYKRVCAVADAVYAAASNWTSFEQNTFGGQLCRAMDSVGANLVEGDARESIRETLRFFGIARSSCREAQYWMERALARKVIGPEAAQKWMAECDGIGRTITSLIQKRRRLLDTKLVREQRFSEYAESEDVDSLR